MRILSHFWPVLLLFLAACPDSPQSQRHHDARADSGSDVDALDGSARAASPDADLFLDGAAVHPRDGAAPDHPDGAAPDHPDGAASGDERRKGGEPTPSPGVLGSKKLRVAVVADLNGSYGTTTYSSPVHGAVKKIVALQPDLVLSCGDMVAGQKKGLDYQAMWAGFHQAVTTRLDKARIPFAVTPGNHDGSGYGAYAEERRVYVEQWKGRRPAVGFVDDTHYPERYSFALGSTLFVSIDASRIGPLRQKQMRWLEGQLKGSGRYSHRVVFGHLPLYPVTQGRERQVIGSKRLERLFVRHKVNVYLSGHHHGYYPGRRGPLSLLSVGCLGGGPRTLLGQTDPSPKSFVLLELGGQDPMRITAYGEPSFQTVLRPAALPERIGAPGQELYRDNGRLRR